MRVPDQAYWPPFPARPRMRTMAVGRPGGDILMQGSDKMLYRCESWQEFKAALERLRLEVVISDLQRWRWFEEAVSDPDCWVVHGRAMELRAIVVQGKRRRHWITCSRVWANREANRSLCHDLEQVAEVTGLGQWSTPSRLGDALQRRAWSRSKGWQWESRPNLPTRDLLLKEGIGGRGQTMGIGSRYSGVWEIDQRDAYAAAWALPKPSGPAAAGMGIVEEAQSGGCAFGEVEFEIVSPLTCIGPLAIRDGDRLQWPTSPGVYRTHAWSLEVADALSCGVVCRSVGLSRAWKRMTADTGWSAEMSETRRGAGGWGSVVKLATVASIGRHGRQPWAVTEVPHGVGYGPGSRSYGRKHIDPPAMTHWYSYALMQARRRLWHRAVAEQWAGRRIIAVEVDAIIMDGPPLGPVVTRGDDHAGEWSIRRSDSNVWTPVLRWAIFAEGESRMPGLPGAMRTAWLAAHAPPLVTAA